MTVIPFGPYSPDTPDLDSDNGVVNNVIPRKRGYGPLPSLSAISSALAATPLGAIVARTATNTFLTFVGTATKLYKYNSASLGWTDVTRVSGGNYSASAANPWSFAQYGTKLVAVNINDVAQVIDVDAGSAFAALGGSPPQASVVAALGEFLVLGCLSGYPNRIHWSAIGDITGWTAGTNSSDTQDFPDGGPVRAIAGYEAGYVFQQDSIRRMIFTPGGEPDYVFRFEKVEANRGSVSPRSVIPVGERVFYLAKDGFYFISQAGSQNIGFERVNDTFLNNIDQTELVNVIGCADPLHPRVYWAYKSSDAATSYLNKMLIYDWAIDRFAPADVNQYLMFPAAISGVTLDGLDSISSSLDALQYSLDSAVWSGGAPVLASFDTDKKLAFFQGTNTEATLATGELEINQGSRSYVSKVRPVTDAPTPYISVSSRNTLQQVAVTSSERTAESDGFASQRVSGRYLRHRMRIASAAQWTYALGVDPIVKAEGTR